MDESGARCAVDSADVNRYIRDMAGQDFTAKDFRTWAGTVLATRELYAAGPCRDEKEGKSSVVEAVKRVARQLGNRPATCRKYYIHPAILEAYSDGLLFSTMEAGEERAGGLWRCRIESGRVQRDGNSRRPSGEARTESPRRNFRITSYFTSPHTPADNDQKIAKNQPCHKTQPVTAFPRASSAAMT